MMKIAFLSLGLLVGIDAIEDKPKKTFRQQITAQAHHLNMGGVAAVAGAAIGVGSFGNFAGALGTISDKNGAGGQTRSAETLTTQTIVRELEKDPSAQIEADFTKDGMARMMRIMSAADCPFYFVQIFANGKAVDAPGECLPLTDAYLSIVRAASMVEPSQVSQITATLGDRQYAISPDGVISCNINCVNQTSDEVTVVAHVGWTKSNFTEAAISNCQGQPYETLYVAFDDLSSVNLAEGAASTVTVTYLKHNDAVLGAMYFDDDNDYEDASWHDYSGLDKASAFLSTAVSTNRGINIMIAGSTNSQADCQGYVQSFEQCIPSTLTSLGLTSSPLSERTVAQLSECWYWSWIGGIRTISVDLLISTCQLGELDKFHKDVAVVKSALDLLNFCAGCDEDAMQAYYTSEEYYAKSMADSESHSMDGSESHSIDDSSNPFAHCDGSPFGIRSY